MNHITTEECISYADLILHLVAVREADTVFVSCDFDHAPLVYALSQQAYRLGARYVEVHARSDAFVAHRARYSRADYLDYVPQSMLAALQECCDNKSCVISIRSPEKPGLNEGISSEVLARIVTSVTQKTTKFHDAILSDEFSWIVTAFPTPGWAKNVYGELPEREGVRKLWEAVRRILRLDTDSPIGMWKEQQKTLLYRRNYFDKKKYKELHLVGAGTDIYVALHHRSRWGGGAHKSRNGRYFQANVPTEEVYTTPDCRYTRGVVQVQRPVKLFGELVKGIRMRFENGKVVDASAEEKESFLLHYLNAHERNRYMGEIALVDTHSLVWKSGLVFNSILYDENAGVHFALGSAYSFLLERKETEALPSEEERIAMGYNCSPFHKDFIVGCEKLNVFGVRDDGIEEEVIRDGAFCIPQE